MNPGIVVLLGHAWPAGTPLWLLLVAAVLYVAALVGLLGWLWWECRYGYFKGTR